MGGIFPSVTQRATRNGWAMIRGCRGPSWMAMRPGSTILVRYETKSSKLAVARTCASPATATSSTWASSESRSGIRPVPPRRTKGASPAAPTREYLAMTLTSLSASAGEMRKALTSTSRYRVSIPQEMPSCVGPNAHWPRRGHFHKSQGRRALAAERGRDVGSAPDVQVQAEPEDFFSSILCDGALPGAGHGESWWEISKQNKAQAEPSAQAPTGALRGAALGPLSTAWIGNYAVRLVAAMLFHRWTTDQRRRRGRAAVSAASSRRLRRRVSWRVELVSRTASARRSSYVWSRSAPSMCVSSMTLPWTISYSASSIARATSRVMRTNWSGVPNACT